ncbi:signal recognition particle-docking protein FtsY [Secundilactobacillus paracollinoides]|uniref:Signal recognition particle receptor FtsY n=2 Tax=Secundilactobacillus paracollinoides TaxID=240427 RepID=A0A1B2J153_9LACO|nr:signal recognition particle-docking protein FtsY [Secundilactobacillus paracollinoides]ANZ62116.1 signal recognition particle-docking protein FtsY [Secundilactobacillus paracollinoides]ANZ68064.1 signal recognition particle-docking protein FtsY [Secundilactobacillus paracollinoides]KRL76465.1 signal recognition particle-docking protein FtsY [Secundilactobacillus paracollinoides DSM 15502 = JCM 11969]
MGLFDFFKRRSKADEERKPEQPATPVEPDASSAPADAQDASPDTQAQGDTTPADEMAETTDDASATAVPDEATDAPETESEPESESQTDEKPDSQSEPVSEPKTEPESESEPESKLEPESESEPELDTDSDLKTDTQHVTDADNATADSEPELPSNADEVAPTDTQNTDVSLSASEAPTVEADRSTTEQDAETDAQETVVEASKDRKTDVDATVEPVSEATEPETSTTEKAPTDAERYDKGLEKSRTTFGERLNHLLANFRHVDESFFDDLEETLIGADVGYEAAMQISDQLRDEVKLQNAKRPKDVQNVVVEKLIDLYDAAGTEENNELHFADKGPTVILFVGVNGVGKTTTIGKMAKMFKTQGKKVLLAAADTFRAGAIEQLNVWAKRDGVDIVMKPEKSDPSAVVFDAVKKAKAEDYDILFVDTAGRLQNKSNLMNELAKMKRVISREIPNAPHEVLLVLDSTTGQNALNQAKLFKETTDVTGIVLTKLDGTARGGIVLAIRNELHLPVKYVGLGEQVDDLRPFEPTEFVYGLFKGLIDVK